MVARRVAARVRRGRSLAIALVASGMFLALAPLEARENKIEVLTTFAPIFSLTAQVAGDAAKVSMLLPPNAEPHDFALSPSDLRKIQRANIVVFNGLGLDDWIERAAARSGGSRARVEASRGIKTIGGSKAPNPHVWLDPLRAIRMVGNIRDALKQHDPDKAATYEKNARESIARLRRLHDEIAKATAGIPEKRLITFHDSFAYFAERYGFKIVGVVQPAPGRELPPKQLKRLHETIREKNVRVVFGEAGHESRFLKTLAAELNLRIATLDPIETGAADPGFYEAAMRQNLRSLKEALDGRR